MGLRSALDETASFTVRSYLRDSPTVESGAGAVAFLHYVWADRHVVWRMDHSHRTDQGDFRMVGPRLRIWS